jgi:tRNA1Val (adenine37-N6)-methyltransferase
MSNFPLKILIEQDRCAMKVGTDGVLLGAWTPIENNRSAWILEPELG